jgi:hypothetical protein
VSALVRLLAIAIVCTASRAWAIPAFARKYHTSCQTCHTIYPKLTPFGEAFRRNGFRFPGHDSDFVKEEPVALGQEAFRDAFPGAVWPGSLAGSVPLAVGFTGAAVVHPDTSAGAAVADNGAWFTMSNLVAEAELWAGGSFDDTTTYFAELSVSDEGVELEHAEVLFADLLGPAHAVNLTVGRAMPTLSSFGPHSTYIADTAMPMVPVTAAWGAQSDSFTPGGSHDGVELAGTVGGRVAYAVGLTAGTDVEVRTSADVHAHAGFKLGGAALDGEGGGSTDLASEHAVTLDVFAVRARSRFTTSMGAPQNDVAQLLGASVRAQWSTLELDTGIYVQHDDRALADGSRSSTLVQWNELSWLAYPWLAAAGRVELIRLDPAGDAAVSDLRLVPGVAALVRPNLKLSLSAAIERARGAPSAGWEPTGGAAAPTSPGATVRPEIESITAGLSCAF